MIWTSYMVDRLRALAIEGKSLSEAGLDLGVTREAVGGKAYRLGVRFGSKKRAEPAVFRDAAHRHWNDRRYDRKWMQWHADRIREGMGK